MKIEVMQKLLEENVPFSKALDIIATYSDVGENMVKIIFSKLKKSGWHKYSCNVMLDGNVRYYRNLDERLRLVDKLRECDYDREAYKIAVRGYILATTKIDEQLNLMDEYNKTKSPDYLLYFSSALKKIRTKKKLKLYLKQLEDSMGATADIKSDTVVPKYRPGRKN